MMKHFMKFMAIYALAITMFSVGCDPDPPVTPEADPPTLAFVEEDPFFYSDFSTNDTSSYFKTKVTAAKGTADLHTLTVYEDDVVMSTDRLLDGTGSHFSANPVLVVDETDKAGFSWEVWIKTQNIYGTKTFKIEVEDDKGKTADVSITVTTIEPDNTTPLDSTLTGVLFNRAGPVGTGGINLLTGAGTGSSTAGSHLRDEGGVDPWLQKISGINGSVIKMPAETIDFDAVDTKDAIMEAWNAGTVVDVTPKLTGGEVLIVQNGEDTFLVRIDEVVVVSTDNSDHYNMSIKY